LGSGISGETGRKHFWNLTACCRTLKKLQFTDSELTESDRYAQEGLSTFGEMPEMGGSANFDARRRAPPKDITEASRKL
jgi:hypothetical protein